MLFKWQQRFQKLDLLIRHKSTGNPQELAKKLGISVRQWYKLKDALIGDLALPIEYDSYCQTYYYTRPGVLRFEFDSHHETKEEQNKILNSDQPASGQSKD